MLWRNRKARLVLRPVSRTRSRLAIHDPQIRKQQSLLAAQHRDDDRRLDAELHSERVEDNAVNVGQAVRSNLLLHIPSN